MLIELGQTIYIKTADPNVIEQYDLRKQEILLDDLQAQIDQQQNIIDSITALGDELQPINENMTQEEIEDAMRYNNLIIGTEKADAQAEVDRLTALKDTIVSSAVDPE